MENAGADDQHHQQLGFRDHRFMTALSVAAWGIASILSTTACGVVPNPGHVILIYFLFLMAGVVLILLTVVAQDRRQPMADRAADRLEGWIRAFFYNDAHAHARARA